MKYILAIDQGTSSTRAMLYDTNGVLVQRSQYALNASYPHPGWVEQDPEAIWKGVCDSVRDVLATVDAADVLCCGITNQRETTLVWDKHTGNCIAPALVWQDRRTEDYCKQFQDLNPMIRDKTGLVADPYFSASKLHWILKHYPKARSLADSGRLCFGTVDSFLMWRLTSGARHVTDSTNASRTLLYNIREGQWDNELLRLFDIPASVLPEVLSCDASFGVIDPKWFGSAIPITGVAGDQQAALMGQGCFQPGMVKATYGTGAFLLMNTGDTISTSSSGMLSTIAYQLQGTTTYGLEGSMYHAGTSIKWMQEQLGFISTPEESEVLAASLESNDGVYFVSAFTGLGAPYWRATSGAWFSGLSRATGKAHMVRAALEGVCYQTRDVLECMRRDTGVELNRLRVDGGMTANGWMLQFLADQCQVLVQKPVDIESTSKGAAFLAGLGQGVYTSLEAIGSVNPVDREYTIQRSPETIARDYQGWCEALGICDDRPF